MLDVTWVIYFAAREQAGYHDGDSTEPHERGWEFTKERDNEVFSAVGDAVLVTKFLIMLHLTNLSF